MAAGCGRCAACWHSGGDPQAPFLAAVAQALQFGLFDLGRLEAMILQQVAGAFFHLDEGDQDA